MGIYFNYINKRMKKFFTSIVVALCFSVSVLAQTTTINVQGQQRKVSATVAARIQKAAEAVTSTGIDFSKIERWAGEGDCKAALAIKWADGQNDGKTLVWGYRWNKGETKTGEDLVRAVAKADPALYVLAEPGSSFGTAFGGFGYDIDGNRYVTVTTPEKEVYPRNGIVYVSSGVFDKCGATEITRDAWNSGWYSGFWSYNVAEKAEDALGFSSTGASGRVLTDGCVDAWVFTKFPGASNEYDGNLEYLPATIDYTQGVFIVNEDWFGHRNSTTNYLTHDGKFVYNNTTEIGATACFGAAWGNRYYIIAKQAKDGGATVEGGRITICDANTMRIIKQIKDIDGNEGRSFCGVDEHKAYVSTSKGIYTLNLDELTVGAAVKNADGGDANLGECGNMVRLGDYVYATEYGKSLRIIDCNNDRIVATITAKVYSITMSKDGQLWVSTDKGISRVNTESRQLEEIALPSGVSAPANSSYAWNPDGLCASLQNNVIYWTSASGWNTATIFKYDIDNNEFAKVVDLTNDANKWVMYSTSNLRVDPVTDNLYVSLFKSWGSQDYAVRIYDNKGTQLNEYELTQKNYWFPGMFVFPDVEDPIVGNIDDVTVEENKEVVVDLTDVCSDADNFQTAIVKTVKSVAYAGKVATATVKNCKLVVTGVKKGKTNVTLNFCSNGISTTATVKVVVTQATGITGTQNTTDIREIARYTIDGKRINQPQRGVNIVKYSDGTVKKVVVK